jgi:preprotein translocase subunit SecG
MLQSIVLVIHLLVAALIIVFVLLQRGKGAEAGTGFGAGASGTVFGARGTSSFFSRTTAILATLFFATSLGLAYFATRGSAPQSVLQGSVLKKGAQSEPAGSPAGAQTSEKAEAPAKAGQAPASGAPAAQAPASETSKPPAIEPPPALQQQGGKSDGAAGGGAPKK